MILHNYIWSRKRGIIYISLYYSKTEIIHRCTKYRSIRYYSSECFSLFSAKPEADLVAAEQIVSRRARVEPHGISIQEDTAEEREVPKLCMESTTMAARLNATDYPSTLSICEAHSNGVGKFIVFLRF